MQQASYTNCYNYGADVGEPDREHQTADYEMACPRFWAFEDRHGASDGNSDEDKHACNAQDDNHRHSQQEDNIDLGHGHDGEDDACDAGDHDKYRHCDIHTECYPIYNVHHRGKDGP